MKLYENALSISAGKNDDIDEFLGDIHVKISTIHQGKGRLEIAVEHLTQAKDFHKRAINEGANSGRNQNITLEFKLIEIITTIANIFVDMNKMSEAQNTYQVIKA